MDLFPPTLATSGSLFAPRLDPFVGSVEVASYDTSTLSFGFTAGWVDIKTIGSSSLGVFSAPEAYDPADGRPKYRLEVLDVAGTKYCDLDQAVLGKVSWELNRMSGMSFSLPVDDPKAAEVKAAEREVRIWKGKRLIWWGVITRTLNTGEEIQVTCQDLFWYFKRRVFGRAGRRNYFDNHSFENNLASWGTGWSPYEESHRRIIGSFGTSSGAVLVGGRAAYMRQYPNPNNPKYGFALYQSILWTVPSTSNPYKGDKWTVAVWAWIPSGEWIGPIEDGGAAVVLIRSSVTEKTVVNGVAYPKVLQAKWLYINNSTPRDQWIRLEATIDVPPGATEFLSVQLICPNGGIYYDEVSLTVEEQTSYWNTEQATIIAGIFDHAQDPDYGKSDLRIGRYVRTTGIKRPEVVHLHQDHESILDALLEFTTFSNGVDMSIEFTESTRTFTTYYPKKGRRRGDLALEFGKNVTRASVTIDGERISNSVIVLAEGEGSDREEAGAIDATALDGGLTLERVYNATPGTGIDSLQRQADRGLARFKAPLSILEVETNQNAINFIGNVQVGDTIPVKIVTSNISIAADYRLLMIELDPATDNMRLTLNPLTEEF